MIILIFFACALRQRQSDDRLLCDIEISGKTQNYRLKSVCNFKVTQFYLILLCKQYNWTSDTKSIEISSWSCENWVSKLFVIFLNFLCLIACLLCCLLMSFFSPWFVVRDLCRSGCKQNYYVTPPPPTPSLFLFLALPAVLSLIQVTVI